MVEPRIENNGFEEDTVLPDQNNLFLRTNDRFGISNQVYHELSMVYKEAERKN